MENEKKFWGNFLQKIWKNFYGRFQNSFMKNLKEFSWKISSNFYEKLQRIFMKSFKEFLWKFSKNFYKKILLKILNVWWRRGAYGMHACQIGFTDIALLAQDRPTGLRWDKGAALSQAAFLPPFLYFLAIASFDHGVHGLLIVIRNWM